MSSTAPVSGDNSDKQKYLTQTMIIVLSTFQIIDTYQDEGYYRGVERGDLLSWSHVSSVFRDSRKLSKCDVTSHFDVFVAHHKMI